MQLFKNFSTVCCDPQNQRQSCGQWRGRRCFSWICLLSPTDVDNFVLCSSASLITSSYIWKFSLHMLLKPSFKDFEHNLANMWNKYNCTVVWLFFALPFFEIGMKPYHFESCGHHWVFQICSQIEWSTLPASSFRIWNSSARILSPPLDLSIVMPFMVRLISHSRMVQV